jgi:hypothetical protein
MPPKKRDTLVAVWDASAATDAHGRVVPVEVAVVLVRLGDEPDVVAADRWPVRVPYYDYTDEIARLHAHHGVNRYNVRQCLDLAQLREELLRSPYGPGQASRHTSYGKRRVFGLLREALRLPLAPEGECIQSVAAHVAHHRDRHYSLADAALWARIPCDARTLAHAGGRVGVAAQLLLHLETRE